MSEVKTIYVYIHIYIKQKVTNSSVGGRCCLLIRIAPPIPPGCERKGGAQHIKDENRGRGGEGAALASRGGNGCDRERVSLALLQKHTRGSLPSRPQKNLAERLSGGGRREEWREAKTACT